MNNEKRCPRNHEPDFYGRVCRTCDRERSRKKWMTPARKEYHHKYYLKLYKKHREIVNRSKMKPCTDCGVQYPPWVMQFDHRDIKEKGFTICARLNSITTEKLLKEIEKCDVVCANCHADRTHKNKEVIRGHRVDGRLGRSFLDYQLKRN